MPDAQVSGRHYNILIGGKRVGGLQSVQATENFDTARSWEIGSDLQYKTPGHRSGKGTLNRIYLKKSDIKSILKPDGVTDWDGDLRGVLFDIVETIKDPLTSAVVEVATYVNCTVDSITWNQSDPVALRSENAPFTFEYKRTS
ncbi:MAG: hypothetical protein M1343_08465 [Chloroflexi bacterium]|nr:hypothetical protein [Chloroflexota bacterium]